MTKKEEGIRLDKLTQGTKILLGAAQNQLYDIEIIDGSLIMISGGDHFSKPTQAMVCGSYTKEGDGKMGWICRDMSIVVCSYDTKAKVLKRFITLPVKTATVYAKDDSWSFEVW